jgi:hypothetical protein
MHTNKARHGKAVGLLDERALESESLREPRMYVYVCKYPRMSCLSVMASV